MKHWENKATALLDASLYPLAQELNELDWKETLSPNNKKLSQHLCAFANYAGGGFLVFGINDITGEVPGITKKVAEKMDEIIKFDRDRLTPFAQSRAPADLDHGAKVNDCQFEEILYPITGLCK
jgi:ATP-dependent DNA helicase RecG